MTDTPLDDEVVILSQKSFSDYASKLESYNVQTLTVGENGDVNNSSAAYMLTLEEDPIEDGTERKWDFMNLCATEADADALITHLKTEEEELWADKNDKSYDEATAKRCLERRYYKRQIRVIQ